MNTSHQATILIVAGPRDQGQAHRWAHLPPEPSPKRHVICAPAPELDKPSCARRGPAIQPTLELIESPIAFVAPSASVGMLMHRAQRHAREIKGALRVAPPDFEATLPAGCPTPDVLQTNGWLRVPPAGAELSRHRGFEHQRLRCQSSIASRKWQATGAASWSPPGRQATSIWRPALASGCWPNSASIHGNADASPVQPDPDLT